MTDRTDPKQWTVPRVESAIQGVVDDLRRTADRIEATLNFCESSDTPYFSAASEVQQEFRSLLGNIGISSVYDAAFDAETITIESLERDAEKARKIEEAKTPQFPVGEDWHPVTLWNVDGSTRSHYFVNGAGFGDGSLCGRAEFNPPQKYQNDKPVCKRCEQEVVLR